MNATKLALTEGHRCYSEDPAVREAFAGEVIAALSDPLTQWEEFSAFFVVLWEMAPQKDEVERILSQGLFSDLFGKILKDPSEAARFVVTRGKYLKSQHQAMGSAWRALE